MSNFPFIDTAIAAIVIIAILIGAKEGFVKSILGLGGIIISLIAAYLLSGWLVNIFDSLFGVRSSFDLFFEKILIDLNVTSELDGHISNIFAVPLNDGNMAQEVISSGMQALKLPEFVSNTIKSTMMGDLYSYDYTSNITLANILGPIISDAVLTILATILLFLIFKIGLSFIERAINSRNKAKPVEAVDKILGIAIGFVKAIMVIALCLTVITFIFPNENVITLGIEKSTVGKFLYENNPLPRILMKYI